jgi:hypothetical protein
MRLLLVKDVGYRRKERPVIPTPKVWWRGKIKQWYLFAESMLECPAPVLVNRSAVEKVSLL